MRPALLFFVAFVTLVAAGCGTTASAPPDATTPPETTTVPTTEAAPPATPPTTVAETTTTTVPAVPGSPVEELDAFRWTFITEIAGPDTEALTIRSSGTHVDGDFACEVATGLPGAELASSFLSVDGRLHVASPEGHVPLDDEAVDALIVCPGSRAFWEGIAFWESVDTEVPLEGERETVNGQTATRVDLTGRLIDRTGFGLVPSPADGVAFEEAALWATEDGWITALEVNGRLEPDQLGEMAGVEVGEDGWLRLRVDVTDPDDPALSLPAR